MKKIIGVVALAVLLVVTSFVILKNRVNISHSELESFHYNKILGILGSLSVDLYEENGIVYYKKGYNGEAMVVDSSFLKELETLVLENGIASWNGFDKSASGLYDGGGFTILIKYKDGKIIKASGYGYLPDNYRKVETKIDEFFDNIDNSLNVK